MDRPITYITVTGNSNKFSIVFSNSFVCHLTKVKKIDILIDTIFYRPSFAIHNVNLILLPTYLANVTNSKIE